MHILPVQNFKNYSQNKQNFNGKFLFDNYDKEWNPETRTESKVESYVYVPNVGETLSSIKNAIKKRRSEWKNVKFMSKDPNSGIVTVTEKYITGIEKPRNID